MKRIFALLMALPLMVALVACSGNSQQAFTVSQQAFNQVNDAYTRVNTFSQDIY